MTEVHEHGSQDRIMVSENIIVEGSLEDRLLQAAKAQDIDLVREILAQGPDLEARLPSGAPITFAKTSDEIRELMLECGADINAKTLGGTTLLHNNADEAQMVQMLLRRGADVNAREDDNRTPLFSTVHGEDPEVVHLLIQNGADVNARDNDGKTALHSAVFFRNRTIAEALLRNEADVNARDNEGRTPLHNVNNISIDKENIIGLLLDYGADVNAASNDGSRAIHWAAIMGDDFGIQRLLDAGAEINPVNQEGKTPLDYTIYIGIMSTIKLLRSRGALENSELLGSERQ